MAGVEGPRPTQWDLKPGVGCGSVRRNLAIEDLGDLLELPLVAVLATYRQGGTVLLSPVWHEWRDGGFNVVTGGDGVKVRHLGRDPRASIVVYEHEPPYRGVEVRGRAGSSPSRRTRQHAELPSVTSASQRGPPTPNAVWITCSSGSNLASYAPGISPTSTPRSSSHRGSAAEHGAGR